jgi:hypothetical protein
VALLEGILYPKTYAPQLDGCHVEMRVLAELLKAKAPKLHRHMEVWAAPRARSTARARLTVSGCGRGTQGGSRPRARLTRGSAVISPASRGCVAIACCKPSLEPSNLKALKQASTHLPRPF